VGQVPAVVVLAARVWDIWFGNLQRMIENKNKINGKNKNNGNGQECPFHTDFLHGPSTHNLSYLGSFVCDG
jgi:hypothetical protein